MPNRIGPSVRGARAAKELLLRIERACERSIVSTGDIDPAEIAVMLEASLADASNHPGLLLALAEALAMTVTGSPVDPRAWTPLKYFAATDSPVNIHIPLPNKQF